MKQKSVIKNNELKNAIKLWSKYNDIEKVVSYIGTYDHGGICLFNSLIILKHYPSRLEFHFWKNNERKLKNEHVYTISELIGDEDE